MLLFKQQEKQINVNNFVQGIDYYHDPDEIRKTKNCLAY